MARTKKKTTKITAVDLFCGAGGLTRGLLNSGIKVAAGIDIDDACRFPYEHNNKNGKKSVTFVQRSVSDLTGADLEKFYPEGSIRVLVGCAPCQPFSKYTQGQSSEKDDKWGLLGEFARLIREVQPDIVSMENVPELQKHSIFKRFLAVLREEGFFFEQESASYVVYCPDYGIPQSRRRLVVLASRLGPINLIPASHHEGTYLTVKDAIGKLPKISAGEEHDSDPLHKSSRLSSINLARIEKSVPGGTWRDWPEELIAECHKSDRGSTYPSVYGRMKWDEPSPTITTQFYGFGNGRFGHPKQNRGLSLREGAILQSFPLTYQFAPPKTAFSFKTVGRLIGNAVPVRLGEIIGKSIINHLKKHGY